MIEPNVRNLICAAVRITQGQLPMKGRQLMTLNLKQPVSEWAQAILAVECIRFVVLDTTSLKADADILRVLIADRTQILYDQIILPGRDRNPNTTYTGISAEHMLQSPTLADCWQNIEICLRGAVILAYNLDFVQERLRENATAYELPIIPLVGSCLQRRAESYFNGSGRLSLSDACKRIGHQLPNPALAPDRAAGQLALLRAMAQGVTSVATMPEPATTDTELDEQPF